MSYVNFGSSVRGENKKKFFILKLFSACFPCGLQSVLFDHSIFRFLCFLLKFLNPLSLKQVFTWNFWFLFFNLLVFMKGFGIPKCLFNVNKERIFYSIRYKQKLLLPPWSVLRNLGFSSEIDYCMSLWKLHNLNNGFIYTTRIKTWHIS